MHTITVVQRDSCISIIIGASLSEPHIDGTFMRELFIGASLSEPHINGTAMRAIYGICIYVYMYICIIYMVRPSHSVYMRILI